MPNDQNSSQNRRTHYHRGRRGGERRNTERRTPPAGPEPSHRDHVDVEQIMRDIRARIASRHGIDLTAQQIQELAARRLDAILEPRHVKPALLEQMRRAAGEAIEVPLPAPSVVAPFDEQQLYTSHRGLVQWLRRVLNPILKLFINPTPIARALSAQAAHSNAAAVREAELHTRQAEWNALHYEIIQRLVTELSRTTLEMQSLALRMEALDAKLDFNERRVRAMELTAHQPRPAPRPVEAVAASPDAPAAPSAASAAAGGDGTSEGARRRRRRRRGRRSGVGGAETGASTQAAGAESVAEADADGPGDIDTENGDDEMENATLAPEFPGDGNGSTALEPAHHFSLLQPDERYPSGEVVDDTSEPRQASPLARSEPEPAPAPAEDTAAASHDTGRGPDSTEK